MIRQQVVFALLTLFLFSTAPAAFADDAKDDEDEPQIVFTSPPELEEFQKSSFFRITGVGLFAASAGDLATTEWGLKYPGLYEGNPMADNRGVRIATHVLAPAIVWWTTEKMHKAGRKKLALGIRIGLMVAYSYAAIHNVRMVHGQ
jgi:hypothetical protein